MDIGRTLVVALLISTGSGALNNPASAQSFDERWSIIPKANAQEAAPPNPREETGTPNEITPSAEKKAAPERAVKSARRAERSHAAKAAFAGKASYISYNGGKTA